MNTLIAYATYSSGTEQVSTLIEQTLTAGGQTVTRKQISEVKPEELSTYDLIIFGSPSWDYEGSEGQPHEDFITFMKNATSVNLQDKKCAVFGLGDSTYAIFCGAVAHLEAFFKERGATFATESLKIDAYFFNQQASNDQAVQWAQKLV